MAVYRFRVYIEDNHDTYRDIDVQGRHDFADLHRCIVQAFNFQPGQPADYVTSDSTWYEVDPVTSLDTELRGKPALIKDFVRDPHQRFLCVTISHKEVGLALELVKVLKEEEGVQYPICTRSMGDPPFFTQPPPKPIGNVAEEEDRPKAAASKSAAKSKPVDDDEPSDEDIEEMGDLSGLSDDTEVSGAQGGSDEDDMGFPEEDEDEEDGDGEDDDENFRDFSADDL